jgi:hypothetical protein
VPLDLDFVAHLSLVKARKHLDQAQSICTSARFSRAQGMQIEHNREQPRAAFCLRIGDQLLQIFVSPQADDVVVPSETTGSVFPR